jgi:hypothetical protein
MLITINTYFKIQRSCTWIGLIAILFQVYYQAEWQGSRWLNDRGSVQWNPKSRHITLHQAVVITATTTTFPLLYSAASNAQVHVYPDCSAYKLMLHDNGSKSSRVYCFQIWLHYKAIWRWCWVLELIYITSTNRFVHLRSHWSYVFHLQLRFVIIVSKCQTNMVSIITINKEYLTQKPHYPLIMEKNAIR